MISIKTKLPIILTYFGVIKTEPQDDLEQCYAPLVHVGVQEMQPFSELHGSLQRESCSVPAVSGWLISSSFHGTKGDSFDNFIPNCPFCPITKIMREPSRGEFLHCFKNSCCRKVIQQELGSHIFYLKENSSRRGMKGFHTRLILKLSFKTVAHLSHTSDPSAFCFPTVFRLMRNLTGYPPRLFIILGIMHVLVGHVFRG